MIADCRLRIVLVIAWFACVAMARGQEAGTWLVLVEPKFMKAAVSAPIAGAKRAELAAATMGEAGPVVLSKAEFAALKTDWTAFFAQARSNAAGEVQALKVEYVRDRKKVIAYGIVRSERGLVSGAVLAPGFLDLFKDTLGEKVLVVIPNRTTAYVFPGLAGDYQQYAPMVFEAYRATAFPVSTEVFELSREGMKAVGVFEEPGR